MESRLDLHPEIRALLEEIELLREEVAHLLSEEHDLVHIVSPNVVALFQQKLGPWEIKWLEAKIAQERARRKVELIQAALNRGEMPDVEKIEKQLESELLSWQQRLRETVARYQQAEAYLGSTISTEQERELKKLYYALVKKLHPDLNANLTPEQKRLWHQVQEAYQQASVVQLRALSLMAGGASLEEVSSSEALLEKRRILEAQVHALLARLERLESQPPLSGRERLSDEAWIASRRSALEQQTAECALALQGYEAKLKGFASFLSHGKQPGAN